MSAKRKKPTAAEPTSQENSLVYPRPQEELLIAALDELAAERVLCNTVGRGQFARSYADRYPAANVTLLFLDVFQRDLASRLQSADGELPTNLSFVCESDFPPEPIDLVALACSKTGDAELTRDLLQQAHQRLSLGGRLVAAIDHDADQWLHDQLHDYFPKVTRRPYQKRGVVYLATRVDEPVKYKSFDCQFAFRDQERLVQGFSRPGVFSHRHVDGGARALLAAADVTPGMAILDIGCGAGVVGVAAALRCEGVTVTALDSNARAVQSTQRTAELNDIGERVTAVLDAEGEAVGEEQFDLVVANPPYFSNWRIADHFLKTGARGLKFGGKLLVVTKTPDWFRERLPELLGLVGEEELKGYWVLQGTKVQQEKRRHAPRSKDLHSKPKSPHKR